MAKQWEVEISSGKIVVEAETFIEAAEKAKETDQYKYPVTVVKEVKPS